MERVFVKTILLCGSIGLLGACHTTSNTKQYAAPLPPQNIQYAAAHNLNDIQPAVGHSTISHNTNTKQKKSCSFSSFHRKHVMGYEMDKSTHLGLTFSPDVDVFNPSDTDFKVGLKFTMAFGEKANKRPDCTYGSGFYGYVPYAMNSDMKISGLTNPQSIKGFVEEKLAEREQRQKLREERKLRGF